MLASMRAPTVSDSVFAQQAVDETGPAVAALLTENNDENSHWLITARSCVPDDADQIQGTIKLWTGHRKLDLVLTNGGTGFGQRDVTPEAIQPLLTKVAPGITIAMITASLQVTPFAALSRPICGIRGNTVIITLPGSPKAALENLSAVLPTLPHALELARGATTSRAAHDALANPAMPAGPGSSPAALAPAATAAYGSIRLPPRALTSPGKWTWMSRARHATYPSPSPSTLYRRVPANRLRVSPYPLTPVGDALALVREFAKRLPPINVTLSTNIAGAVVAEDIHAREAVPAYRASTMDGYAVNGTSADSVGTFPVFEYVALAGTEPLSLPSGYIARIATGGPLPEGANAVVPIEHSKLVKASSDNQGEDLVELSRAVKPGENVREIGTDVQNNEVILHTGDVISEVGGEVSLLAASGVGQLAVYRRPVVGIMSTGNEVVDVGASGPLHLGQIRDANRPSLLAAVRAAGFECVDLGVTPDHPDHIEAGLRSALERVDVLITTGGVSMGEADILKSILETRLRATIHFGRVLMKPGKPTTFATVPGRTPSDPTKLVFALPGNPSSALVTFHLFAVPALRRMGGLAKPDHTVLRVRLTHDIQLDSRPEYHRAVVTVAEDGTGFVATSTGEQRSSRMASVRGANALLQLPLASDQARSLSKGDLVEALIIGRI
ncbi:MoaB/Mog domain-containing protein [Syncephalis pseudoplumigaleata]|uniref:MoaB/Mog domain-containing protein n=1 Tax=Syncephalis pseudoplumigaleata TaxID=1712513 RepID=A0A4P9Z667_9FUNG|nr:MoaB/Mog domain-containing protein [Syncephalis pseudoplumigaleata]|eukprot:RKP27622.1 MoaB/Mog domain-containing protein [Syncephalis pseudoplumigaleata]